MNNQPNDIYVEEIMKTKLLFSLKKFYEKRIHFSIHGLLSIITIDCKSEANHLEI